MTTPDSVALPDELRVPMDELEADAGYLMGRACRCPHCADAMAESVRVKIRAIRAEVERLAAQSAPLAQQAREYPPLPKLPTMTVLSELQSGTQEMVRLDVAHEAMRAYVDADRAAAHVEPPAGRVIPADGEVQANAVRDVLAERQRQIDKEGWTPEHDDEHDGHEMAHAAACYAYPELTALVGVKTWPWDRWWLKVRDHRSNYVRAAALLLAEIERLDRAGCRIPADGKLGEGA